MTYRIVARSSRLSLLQVDEALRVLEAALPTGATLPPFEVRPLDSFGDKNKTLSLFHGEAPADVFTRELDEELRAGQADFAIHSAKDLALPLAADLRVLALLPAADQTDALVVRSGLGPGLAGLPRGARVGTSSPHRQQELLKLRPDLTIAGIRGTIEERLAQVDEGRFDAAVVATCALQRLGLGHRIGEVLPFEAHPLQGHLAVTGLARRHDLAALWAPVDVRRSWGKVFLVGAGPGDPELLTLRAHRLLREADVIFSDSLASPRLVEGLGAEVRFVGKRGDAGGELQERIHQALCAEARAGKRVVRLKGGDPMVFGRASEEADHLEQRLVEVELVPGITSAQAASHYAQIPLTERGISASVAFCLGAPTDRITVPTAETLVYYMASATLGAIVDKLWAAGKPASTPLALVRNASLPDQQVWRRSLGSLKDELDAHPDHDYASPLLLFVGPTAREGRLSSWFDRLPLTWYTGTNPDRYPVPGRVVHQPLVRLVPLEDTSDLDARLRHLPDYQWVVFTSRHTVAAVFGRLEALGLDARAFAGARLATVGQSTARDLAARGLRADRVAVPETSEGLVAVLAAADGPGRPVGPGDRVFLPVSDQGLPTIPQGLAALGAVIDRVPAYRNVPVDELPPDFDLTRFNEVVLTSPSAARTFARHFPSPPDSLVLVPMGSQTARTVTELFPGRPQGRPVQRTGDTP